VASVEGRLPDDLPLSQLCAHIEEGHDLLVQHPLLLNTFLKGGDKGIDQLDSSGTVQLFLLGLPSVQSQENAHKQIKENQHLHQLLVLLLPFMTSLLLLFSSLSCLCALCVGWCLVHRACNHLMGLNLLDGHPTVLNELLELVLLVIMNAVLTLKLFLCKLLGTLNGSVGVHGVHVNMHICVCVHVCMHLQRNTLLGRHSSTVHV